MSWPDELRPALVALLLAWAATTVVAILVAARAAESIGDAIIAPLFVATGLGVLLFERRRATVVASGLMVVSGFARGYDLLAALELVPPVAHVATIATWCAWGAILVVFADLWTQRRSAQQS